MANIENKENNNFNLTTITNSHTLKRTQDNYNLVEQDYVDLNDSHQLATLSNQNNSDIASPLVIYKKIKKNIENFIFDFSDKNPEKIYEILNEILKAVNIILEDYHSQKNEKLNTNSKIIFLLKIQKLNQEIKNLQEKLEFYKNFLKNRNTDQKYPEIFMKKFNEQKMISKNNEFKYLLLIGEQEKKINTLEKKLISSTNENIDQDMIKSIKCFPNYRQYDFKDKINYKSVPLYKEFQKLSFSKNAKNNVSLKSSFSQNTKSSIKSIENKIPHTPTHSKMKNIIKASANRNRKMRLTKCDLHRNLKIESFNKTIQHKKKFTTRINITEKSKDNNDNLNSNILEKYKPKTILDNKKEFFVAHPRLDIAGVVKTKEIKYEGLPKKILRLKLHRNLEKNILITFPSSLNDTLCNLEKLGKLKKSNI